MSYQAVTADYFNGNIAEIIAWNDVNTAGDRKTVLEYLRKTWKGLGKR